LLEDVRKMDLKTKVPLIKLKVFELSKANLKKRATVKDRHNKRNIVSSLQQALRRTVSEGEVQIAIKDSRINLAVMDGVNAMVINAGGEALVVALRPIVNTSIVSGPIFKKGDAKECSNYRPVSNLSVMSKVLEAFVNNQITEFCEKSDIIPASQHGFQKSKSTMTALISMVDSW
jgi:hypothetical protein